MGEWSPKNVATLPKVVDRCAERAVVKPGRQYKCKTCFRTLTTPRCLACQLSDAVELKLASKRRAIAVAKEIELRDGACRIEGCTGEPKRRGLCDRCYANAAANVSRGKTSWEELERLQILLPRQAPRADSNFSRMLSKLRAAESVA